MLAGSDFICLRRSGKRLPARYFLIEYRLTELSTARLGLAVSRRVSKHAVVRNAIKRQVRESFRQAKSALPALDILVIARSAAALQAGASLRDDLTGIWQTLASRQAAASALNRNPAAGTMRASFRR